MLFLTLTHHPVLPCLGSELYEYSTNSNFTKKAVRIINFQPRNSHTSHLFKQSSILKSQDKIFLENILFISKSLNNLSPPVFNKWFSFSADHNYEISSFIHRLTSQNLFIREIDLGIIQ